VEQRAPPWPARADPAAPAGFRRRVVTGATRRQFACGPDPERHLAAVQPYLDAGFDEIYVQIGPDQDAFFRGWAEHVLPALSAA
jgi:hypothetical protein